MCLVMTKRQGSLFFFSRSRFFFKTQYLGFEFFSKNVNVVFIDKSEFFFIDKSEFF